LHELNDGTGQMRSWPREQDKDEGKGKDLRLNPDSVVEGFFDIDWSVASAKSAVGVARSGMREGRENQDRRK
jgi:hypothetical protein